MPSTTGAGTCMRTEEAEKAGRLLRHIAVDFEASWDHFWLAR